MKLTFLALCLFIAVSATAWAQDSPYQPQDSVILQNCFEGVADINADAGNTERATYQQCIGMASNACQDETPQSQTTIGMVECTTRETAWWDERLNRSYKTLKDHFPAEEFDALRKAQRAWVQYRDANCQFEYFYWREGTIRSVFGASCYLQMTAERALDLESYVGWTEL